MNGYFFSGPGKEVQISTVMKEQEADALPDMNGSMVYGKLVIIVFLPAKPLPDSSAQ